MTDSLQTLNQDIVSCDRCPRLRAHCNEVARVKVRRYRDEEYWGRPVPSFGDPAAQLLIIGLAPGAHGANRTGRLFTGDDSGAWLYSALHQTGFATVPASHSRDDGLRLTGAYITNVARCAPPGNKPTTAELAACRPFLHRELALLPNIKVVLALGKIAFDSYVRTLREQGQDPGRLAFAHGALHDTGPWLLASYHPSRQNTQTGRLTQDMWLDVFKTARRLVDGR